MPNGDQIEVINPQGQRGTIPVEQVNAALDQGYKPTKHTVMYDSNGARGLVPNEQLRDAIKAGYQTTPKTQFEKERAPENQEGFWPHVGSSLKSVGGGLVNLPLSPSEMISSQIRQGAQTAMDAAARQQEGRSKTYQVAAPIAQTIVPGLNPRAMEEAANKGDTAGVLGEITIPAAAAVLGGEESITGGALSKVPGRAFGAAGNAVRRFVADPVTGRPTVGYRSIAERILRTPEEAQRLSEVRQLADIRRNAALEKVRTAGAPPEVASPMADVPQGNPTPFAPASGGGSVSGGGNVSVFPEPLPETGGARAGSMWTIPRRQLPSAAARGTPGAADVLQSTGHPVLFEPRSTAGTPESAQRLATWQRLAEVPQGNPSPFAPASWEHPSNLAPSPKLRVIPQEDIEEEE